MKKSRMTICWMGAMLLLAGSQASGMTAELKDGGTHNINFVVSDVDNIWVDYLTPGMGTTVNILDGAHLAWPCRLWGWSDSRINISGGLLERYVSARDNSRVTISGGTVGDFDYGLWARGSSNVTISDGSVGSKAAYAINAAGASILSISGGVVGGVNSLYGIQAMESSAVDISGGLFSGRLSASDTSRITIEGSGFAIDGRPVGPGAYSAGDFLGGSGVLTGTLANGDAINNAFTIYTGAELVLVPEPLTLGLLAFGGLLARRRRR